MAGPPRAALVEESIVALPIATRGGVGEAGPAFATCYDHGGTKPAVYSFGSDVPDSIELPRPDSIELLRSDP